MTIFLNIINVVCWLACFVWMYRISTRQDIVLKAITDQGRRIERLSKVEHDLIKEVHPAVGEIKDRIEEMSGVINETSANVKASAES